MRIVRNRRKNATARVFIRKGTGKIDINGRSLIYVRIEWNY